MLKTYLPHNTYTYMHVRCDAQRFALGIIMAAQCPVVCMFCNCVWADRAVPRDNLSRVMVWGNCKPVEPLAWPAEPQAALFQVLVVVTVLTCCDECNDTALESTAPELAPICCAGAHLVLQQITQ